MNEEHQAKSVETGNKGKYLFLGLVVIALAAAGLGKTKQGQPLMPADNQPAQNADAEVQEPSQDQAAEEVMIVIDTGAGREQFSLLVESGATVFNLMQILASEHSVQLAYTESNTGAFIEEIKGIKNDPQKNIFWMYYVNGKSADVGASAYHLQPGDLVEWRYEEFKMQ